jgi:ribosomal protein S12 methylthiotransferase accessory factor
MLAFGAAGKGRKTCLRGSHRTLAPAETLARVEPLLKAFGITRVANLTGLDRTGIPVVMVCRPNARSSAVFHGKGMTVAAAKASGVMEAIETWHAEHAAPPLRFGSAAELAASIRLADVDRLPRLPAGVYDRHHPMLWAEGLDLSDGGQVWVPFEVVHANSAIPGPPASGCFAASTNGLASGNEILEAVSHALCEVIERDATSLWHRMRPALQDAMRIDLATVDDGDCRDVLERLAAADIEVAVWDTTSDIGVPAFQCLLVDRTGAIDHIGSGAGCHATREIALLRALTEAAQVRTTYIVGSREDILPADYQPATLGFRTRHARELMRPVEAGRAFRDCGRFPFDTFEAEVAWLLGRLASVGLDQALGVDLSRPELGVAVVRVMVPGLEGSDHHAGYTPGARARAIAERRP